MPQSAIQTRTAHKRNNCFKLLSIIFTVATLRAPALLSIINPVSKKKFNKILNESPRKDRARRLTQPHEKKHRSDEYKMKPFVEKIAV
jgi:Ni/Co efflux regulator RcnB